MKLVLMCAAEWDKAREPKQSVLMSSEPVEGWLFTLELEANASLQLKLLFGMGYKK